jgi:sulfoxide reductase heme-binding subunit YedZ
LLQSLRNKIRLANMTSAALTGRPWPLWLALAAPALAVLFLSATPDADPDAMVALSGQLAAGLLVATIGSTGLAKWVPGLLRHRRALGLAAFGTSLVHLLLYFDAMGALAPILAELDAPGIWTGWAGLLLLVPLALTSTNAAQSRLGRGWKRLQRLAWPAVLLALAHGYIVHDGQRLALLLGALLALSLIPRSIRGRT